LQVNIKDTKETLQYWGELFKQKLLGLIDTEYPLVKLSKKIDWQSFDEHFGKFYSLDTFSIVLKTN